MSLLLQKELALQAEITGCKTTRGRVPAHGLELQGFWVTKTSDRFKAGRPDLRISHIKFGQLDVELKYSMSDFSTETDVGMTKLQWLKIKEMNAHGAPAVCLVYSEPLNIFFVTTLLRDILPPPSRRCLKSDKPTVIVGADLFNIAMRHLTHDLGYHYARH